MVKFKKYFLGAVTVVFALVFVFMATFMGHSDTEQKEKAAGNFLYISHRGGCDLIPENTREAFTHALDMGFDGVELDVWETDSGELLVFHDATLERMCNSEGYIWEVSTQNRNQYPIQFDNDDGDSHDENKNILIPTLEEVLDVLKDKQCPIYLHIKIDKGEEHYFSAEAAKQVATLLKEREMVERAIVFSTYQNIVMSLFFNQGLHLGHITGQTEREKLDKRIAWCVENHVETLILYKMDGIKLEENGADLVKACHDKGLSVGVYKVTTKEDEMLLIETGADFSISMKAFFK